MKRVGLFLLVIVMALGVAGCSKKDADPVGTWTIILDEACNGADVASVFHIYDNGAFIVDGGWSGTWTVDKDSITLNLADVSLLLIGTIDGGGMSGNIVGTASGCWTGARTSTTP